MNTAYIRHALTAAIRVARFEKDAINDFDHSFEGFFRSFFLAFLISLPFYPILVWGERMIAAEADAIGRGVDFAGLAPVGLGHYLVESGAYILSWIVFPIAMIFVARLIGAAKHYVSYVVAYNWGSCIVLAVTLPPHILYLMGVISLDAMALLYYPVIAFALIYRWRVAQTALELPGYTATAVVIIDVLISIFIAIGAARLQQGI